MKHLLNVMMLFGICLFASCSNTNPIVGVIDKPIDKPVDTSIDDSIVHPRFVVGFEDCVLFEMSLTKLAAYSTVTGSELFIVKKENVGFSGGILKGNLIYVGFEGRAYYIASNSLYSLDPHSGEAREEYHDIGASIISKNASSSGLVLVKIRNEVLLLSLKTGHMKSVMIKKSNCNGMFDGELCVIWSGEKIRIYRTSTMERIGLITSKEGVLDAIFSNDLLVVLSKHASVGVYHLDDFSCAGRLLGTYCNRYSRLYSMEGFLFVSRNWRWYSFYEIPQSTRKFGEISAQDARVFTKEVSTSISSCTNQAYIFDGERWIAVNSSTDDSQEHAERTSKPVPFPDWSYFYAGKIWSFRFVRGSKRKLELFEITFDEVEGEEKDD